MRSIITFTLTALLIPAGVAADQRGELAGPAGPPAPAEWSRQDPADSLYRAAREAMNGGDHERAATLFARIWDRHPRSGYAPDAPYWQAFNLYRSDDTADLQRAIEVLEIQAERYAQATTLKNGDARALYTRINGILARRGDERSARAVVATATQIARAGEMSEESRAALQIAAEEIAAQGRVVAAEARAVAEASAAVARGGRSRSDDLPQECREQAETQLAALNALLHMGADRAMPVLEQVMARRDACSTPLRRRAVFLIAEKESPRSVDILLQTARTDPDLEVRRQAVFWLSEVDDARAVDALDQVLRESEDEKIRERAVFALSQHESERARQILRRVAADGQEDREIRRKAIFWLGQEGGQADVDFLKNMLGRTGDTEIDERIIFAVAQSDRPDNARWLLSIAESDRMDTELRRAAIFWAAEAGVSADALGQLYGRLQDRKLKERVLFGLSQSDQREAIDRLIAIARSERDTELRKRAIFWLGNSNDPRAVEVLLELINGSGGGL